MNRLRHFLLTAAAALPIGLVSVALTRTGFGGRVWLAALWLLAVVVGAEVLWRIRSPIHSLAERMGLESTDRLPQFVHETQEEALRCRNERAELAELIDDVSTGLGEGLIVVDPGLHLRLCNPRAQHFLGAEAVALGSSLLDLERQPDVVAAVRDAVKGVSGARVLVENSRGIWEIRPFPLRPAGAVILVTEVGPVRRAAELRRRFVQDLSHELRSPLAVMRTTVEALEDEVPPDLAKMMVRQVERIARLTDELYELASIEAGTVKMKPTRQLLLPIVRQVISDYSAVAESAEVDLGTDIAEDLVFEFDVRSLSRVISNLVDNAIKYNRTAGRVTISARRLDEVIRIEVQDTGLGIPVADLGAVMQRFYRVDRARTPGIGGLGLGLAIVKHMVQQMGGVLNLDSREDVGTSVTVELPSGR